MTETIHDSEMERLAAAFAFSAEDLTTNRAGHLTRRQAEWLRRREQRASTIVLLFTLGMAIVPALSLIIFSVDGNMPMAGLSVFLLVGLPLLGYRVADHERRRWSRDREIGIAASIYGQVWPAESPIAGRHPRLRIENLEFEVSPEQLAAFESGAFYSLYYTPRTRVILSVERHTDPA